MDSVMCCTFQKHITQVKIHALTNKKISNLFFTLKLGWRNAAFFLFFSTIPSPMIKQGREHIKIFIAVLHDRPLTFSSCLFPLQTNTTPLTATWKVSGGHKWTKYKRFCSPVYLRGPIGWSFYWRRASSKKGLRTLIIWRRASLKQTPHRRPSPSF